MKIQSTIYYLREYFFPSGCGGCGRALGHADARYGLCEKCRAAFGIALLSGRRCRYCGKPLITEKELCLLCRDDTAHEKPADGKEPSGNTRHDGSYSGHIERLRVLFPYAGKFKTALGSFKFEKATALGIFFARCLSLSIEAFGLRVHGTGVPEPQALQKTAWVPVPPRPGKLKTQGWDQVEFLAKQLGKTGRPPVKRCLKRLPSKSQKLLGREERLANLKGRIRCVKKPPETAILFDDVITTGATLDACAAALLEAGTKRVYAVCLFYR
jgi:ComF family protein